MSLMSKAMSLVPEKIATKKAEIGSYRGDDWDDVNRVISAMCTFEHKGDTVRFIYDGKEIGWAKANGLSWIDNEAYTRIREAYVARRKAARQAAEED